MGDTNVNDLSLQVGVAGDKWATQRVPKALSKFLGWDGSGVLGAYTASAVVGLVTFSVHKNTVAQSVANTANDKITFSTALFDIGGTPPNFDLALERFVAPVTGKYVLNANITINNAGAGVTLGLYKNGTALIKSFSGQVATGPQTLRISAIVDATATDYFELFCDNQSGASRDISGSIVETLFSGHSL